MTGPVSTPPVSGPPGSETTATLHLDPAMLAQARAGQQNFVNRIAQALAEAGWSLGLAPMGPLARLRSRGWSLWHMEDPPSAQGLTLRRCYIGPFWRIERHGRRWDWPVATEVWPATAPRHPDTERFARHWRRQVFGEVRPERLGHIFVPLQGLVTEHRSFQSMSPLEMLDRLGTWFPDRKLIATLHPGETYLAEDHAALALAQARNPRLEIRQDGSERLLHSCDLVACQNSGMAFRGFLLGKPALLFAGIDFHHPAASVWRDGETRARMQAQELLSAPAQALPDFDSYLHWFLQRRAINAGRPEAGAQILARLRALGWPLPEIGPTGAATA